MQDIIPKINYPNLSFRIKILAELIELVSLIFGQRVNLYRSLGFLFILC